MLIHNKGAKADRDRAVLVHSYKAMCKYFNVPRRDRLTPLALASLSNTQIYKLSKDLYNDQPVGRAKRLARKLGLDGTVSEPWYVILWARVKQALLEPKSKSSEVQRG